MPLRERVLLDWLSDTGSVWKWTPPQPPAFASPTDLASILIRYREEVAKFQAAGGRPTEAIADLSNDALTKLLMYSYRASFVDNEHRRTISRIFVPHLIPLATHSDGLPVTFINRLAEQHNDFMSDLIHTFRFAPPIALQDPKIVSRLAPVQKTDDSVLIVREIDGQPHFVSIALLDRDHREGQLFRMPGEGYPASGLLIEILGPGHLRVREGREEYTLRGNEIQVHDHLTFVHLIREWLWEVSRALINTSSKDPHWNPTRLHIFDDIEGRDPEYRFPQADVQLTWSRLLRECLRQGHGGTFVVVPDVGAAPLRIRFPVRPYDLAGEIADTWAWLCRLVANVPEDDRDSQIERTRCQIHSLVARTRAVASLASTDGCVVLDRQMVVHGFGATIQTRCGERSTLKKCLDGCSREPIDATALLQTWGERHRSAFDLCSLIPGSLAFVCSQDGHLRAFASDQEYVYIGNDLQP